MSPTQHQYEHLREHRVNSCDKLKVRPEVKTMTMYLYSNLRLFSLSVRVIPLLYSMYLTYYPHISQVRAVVTTTMSGKATWSLNTGRLSTVVYDSIAQGLNATMDVNNEYIDVNSEYNNGNSGHKDIISEYIDDNSEYNDVKLSEAGLSPVDVRINASLVSPFTATGSGGGSSSSGSGGKTTVGTASGTTSFPLYMLIRPNSLYSGTSFNI